MRCWLHIAVSAVINCQTYAQRATGAFTPYILFSVLIYSMARLIALCVAFLLATGSGAFAWESGRKCCKLTLLIDYTSACTLRFALDTHPVGFNRRIHPPV